MLALVVADRHEFGLVEQDVAGHQHGIREERGRDEFLRSRFSLNCVIRPSCP